jgi:hypothetical protein
MTRRILTVDDIERTVTYFEGDGEGGFSLTQASEDKQWERDSCVQMCNENEEWAEGMKRGYIHYAHIPLHIMAQWKQEGVDINDLKALFAKVNQREYCCLRVVPKIHAPKE